MLIEEADENGNILAPSSSQLSETLDSLTVNYTYDLFNRLLETKTGKKTVSFAYEADGYRHSKSTLTPSSEENIVYFYEGDHVAFESDETGIVTAVNHYGTSQYARTIYEGEEETTFYYQFNAYGDVTALIDTDGNTIAKYEYDAFGNLTSQPDVKVNNSITYRGYEYDAETGLYYLNARYYDSETARFLTEDTYRGEKNDPLSLNLYTYCKNNPLKYVDVQGHMPVPVLRVLSDWYNTGLVEPKYMSMITLITNGGNFFVGLHEIAQLNVAKDLERRGYKTTLEYGINYIDDNGKKVHNEADVVGFDKYGTGYVWEIKPLGIGGKKQIQGYCDHGNLIKGNAYSEIKDIDIFGNVKMNITYYSDGIVGYSLYVLDERKEPAPITNVDAKKLYKKSIGLATALVSAVVITTLVEDVVTGGAGTSDDLPSLGIAYKLFEMAFTH